jgi:hypothetical protein
MGTTKSLALLHSLTQRLLGDIRGSTGLDARVAIDEQQDIYDVTLVMAEARTGFRVLQRLLDEDRAEEVLAEMADDLSEPVMEQVLDMAGVQAARLWPKCPLHDHALNPKLHGGRASWCCDFDKTVAVPVGELAPDLPEPGHIDHPAQPA